MTKEQKAKMKKALNHYISTDKMPGCKEDYLENIANQTLMNQELMMTFNIKQKEIDDEIEKICDDILETYDGQ